MNTSSLRTCPLRARAQSGSTAGSRSALTPGAAPAGRGTRKTRLGAIADPTSQSGLGPAVHTKLDRKHTLSAERLEVIRDMDKFAREQLPKLLKETQQYWEPQDLLPNPLSPTFIDEVQDLRERMKDVPDEHLICLIGDMITEEALPTYMAMLNTLDGTRDETGHDDTPWATWTRKWIAEENRHGDVMNKYLWMTGRVDMKAVERTIQNLIGSGMNPQTENNPYLGFVFTSFQERATKVAHGNTARFAKEKGDPVAAKMLGLIAADEGRHEVAYQRIIEEILRRDPEGGMCAYANMMEKRITMPAHLMDDGEHRAKTGGVSLFDDYAAVAERAGVYNAADYIEIIRYLNRRWDVANVKVRGDDALKAQEYVVGLPDRMEKLAAFAERKRRAQPRREAEFSWICNRKVAVA